MEKFWYFIGQEGIPKEPNQLKDFGKDVVPQSKDYRRSIMNFRNTRIFLVLLFFVLILPSGCAKHATKGKMIGKIEEQTTTGMAEEEFTQKIPHAKMIEQEDDTKVYLVAASDPCFVCGSWDAFVRSYEIYVTKFTFKDGNLISIERIVNKK